VNSGSFLSGAKEDLTPDLLIANQALSQLSYDPEVELLYYTTLNLMRNAVPLSDFSIANPAVLR
jgi:hypothetical protein